MSNTISTIILLKWKDLMENVLNLKKHPTENVIVVQQIVLDIGLSLIAKKLVDYVIQFIRQVRSFIHALHKHYNCP